MAIQPFQISGDLSVPGNFNYLQNLNLFAAINTNYNFATSTNGLTWTLYTTVSPGAKYISYGNGIFFAISQNSQSVGYSTDTVTWNTSNLPLGDQWQTSVYGNGKYVVIASTTSAAYSTDAITWSLTTLPISGNWYSVAYGNGIFVAANALSSTAAYSTNGITWTATTMAGNYALWDSISYGNGVFVSIVYGSPAAATSTNGITWTARTLPSGIDQSWSVSTFGNGLFVALPSSAVATTTAISSTDGITWTARTLPINQQWDGITYGNSSFLGITFNGTSSVLSTNGITWTLATMPAAYGTWESVTYGPALLSTKVQTSSLIANNQNVSSNIQNQLNSLTQSYNSSLTNYQLNVPLLNNYKFIANQYSGSSTFLYQSTDAVTWTQNSIPEYKPWVTPIFAGDRYFLFGVYLYYSYDAITWTPIQYPNSTDVWASITYGNGIYMMNQYYSSTSAAISTNGITWTVTTLAAAFSPSSYYPPVYGNGVFLMINPTQSTQAMSSTNGVTWTIRTMPSVTALNGSWANGPVFGNGVFFAMTNAIGGSQTTQGASSTDGVTWTNRNVGTAYSWQWLQFVGNQFFLNGSAFLTGNYNYVRSTNAVTWTLSTNPESGAYFQNMSYYNGLYYANTTSLNIWTSTDGANWTLNNSNYPGGLWTSPAYQTNQSSYSYVPQVTNGSITGTTYTVGQYDKYLTFLTTATCTVTLPAAYNYPNREITIKNLAAFAINSASSNVIPLGSNTAGTAIVAATAGKYVTLVSNGLYWVVMDGN
jgi:hypothetical protein